MIPAIADIHIDPVLIGEVLIVFLAIGSILWVLRLWYLRPVLSRVANAGTTHTQSIKTPGGLTLLHVIGVSPSGSASEKAESMFMVELPFVTAAHLVGVPIARLRQLTSAHAAMEPVMLEGDYPQYFRLYTEQDGQTESRYMLDPKAMAFTIDFVKEYYWEIRDNALFLIGDETLPSLDTVDRFVAEIRPAVEQPNLNHRNPGKLSYVERGFRTVNCPVCSKVLVGGKEWLECPDGHGCLVTGKQLMLLRKLTAKEARGLPLRPRVGGEITRPSEVSCPYCHTTMTPSLFPGTEVEIDICSHCGYRWFDSHELLGILGISKRAR